MYNVLTFSVSSLPFALFIVPWILYVFLIDYSRRQKRNTCVNYVASGYMAELMEKRTLDGVLLEITYNFKIFSVCWLRKQRGNIFETNVHAFTLFLGGF